MSVLVFVLSRYGVVAPNIFGMGAEGFSCCTYGAICLSEPELSMRLHASVLTPSPPPPLLISLTFFACTLLLDLFVPVSTPVSSKFHSISARQHVIVLSLTLVLLSGTHCHFTLEMLQLSTPSSLL